MSEDKLDDWEDRLLQMMIGCAGVYHLYHRRLLEGKYENAIKLLPSLRGFIKDIEGWLSKHE